MLQRQFKVPVVGCRALVGQQGANHGFRKHWPGAELLSRTMMGRDNHGTRTCTSKSATTPATSPDRARLLAACSKSFMHHPLMV